MGKLHPLLVLAATLIGIGNSSAQVYPSHPIAMIVPFPPGGAVDPVARIVAERMKVPLGQSIVIENVSSGGNGVVGVGRVARAAPDEIGMTVTIALFALAAVLLRDGLMTLMERTDSLRLKLGRGLEVASAGAIIVFGGWLLINR
jgi:tripartite-type tricarboxylate transporter receptor subunit TctC